MNIKKQIKDLLSKKFEARRIDSILKYFLSCAQKFEENDWENSLIRAGKFIEAIVKLLWTYCGKSLPTREKDFKAIPYAQQLINLEAASLPEDGLRIQIPRACIFTYDITSNRGARHDSDEMNANEMDATVILPICSWILAELIRFSAKYSIDNVEAKNIVDFFMDRRYPIFEEIEGRIYVDKEKFKSARECSLLILSKLYPKRISKEILIDLLKRHDYRPTALKLERLRSYVDLDVNGNILLRASGRKEVELILKKRKRSS